MTRLTKAEMRLHRFTLEAWLRPSEMLKRARALMNIMGSEDLFNQAGVDFILEAWAAAQFAKARRALAVRLIATRDRWPDFEVQTRRRAIEQWEVTEVERPRRRRGREYRQIARRRI